MTLWIAEAIRKLVLQKENWIEEELLMSDHVQMMLSIPPNAYGRS